MTEKIPYVIQRGNTYHFRITIPKSLQGHDELPKGSHIQKSWGTSDVGVANSFLLLHNSSSKGMYYAIKEQANLWIRTES